MEKPQLNPRLAGQYMDNNGRTLRVTQINPTDPRGRDIVGKVISPSGSMRDYSCTMRNFPEIWIKEIL